MPEAAPQAAGPAATAERGGRRQQVLRLSRADEDEAALPTNGLLGWDSLARLETLSHSRRTFGRTRQRRRQCLPVDELAAGEEGCRVLPDSLEEYTGVVDHEI